MTTKILAALLPAFVFLVAGLAEIETTEASTRHNHARARDNAVKLEAVKAAAPLTELVRELCAAGCEISR